jgi:Flp pilus assembly protein TadD
MLKKIIGVGVTAALALSLAACGSQDFFNVAVMAALDAVTTFQSFNP